MTPEEFAAKLEELRLVIADKITDLEEDPKWASVDERDVIIQALDELVVQAEAMSETLQEGAEENEASHEE
jgi:hypothetical protein